MAKGFGKKICILTAAFSAAVLVAAFTPLANIAARPLIIEAEPAKGDVIAVLGGGVYKNGALGHASVERLVHGVVLYRQGLGKRLFFTGGASSGFFTKAYNTLSGGRGGKATGAYPEGAVMKSLAVQLGAPVEAIEMDDAAMNTRENLVNLDRFMKDKGLSGCVIVTSSTHMLRASLAAKKLGLDCSLAPLKETASVTGGGVARLALAREVFWEYAGLALYRLYGYI